MIVVSLITGFALAFLYNPDMSSLKASMDANWRYMAMAIGLLIVAIATIVTLFWVVYRLLYGILLKKLLVNYRELKKINL
jgi:flagellar biogenesis protein FliO